MKILFPERIEEFSRKHADAKEALERWSGILADAEWKTHADLKADFPSADFVGNNRMCSTSRVTTIGQSCWWCFLPERLPLGLSARMVSMTRLRILKIYRL